MGRLSIGVLVLAVLGSAHASSRVRTGTHVPQPDSIRVMVRYKLETMYGFMVTACGDHPGWGWDSVAVSAIPGAALAIPCAMPNTVFRLGRRAGPQSVWLVYRHQDAFVATAKWDSVLYRSRDDDESAAEWDSVLLTPARLHMWSWARYSAMGRCMEHVFRLVRPGEGTPASAPRTGHLAGRLLDMESGQPIRAAWVLVLDSKAAAMTDSLGRFALTGVPAGNVTVHACTWEGRSRETDVKAVAPSDTLVIRL